MRCHLRLFDIKWAHMRSNDISYELKWHLIWAQMRPHMSSNETHMRFRERWRRTAMPDRVSTLITGGVHIDHPHTTNIAGNSKWFWKFKIRFFCLIWDLKWEIEVYRWSKIDEKIDVTKKTVIFQKILVMIPTVTKYEFPTPLQLEDICKNENTCFFPKKTSF